MSVKFSKVFIATAIAVLFHCIGLAGMLFSTNDLFAQLTPLNLMLSCGLLLYTQPNKNKSFYLFFTTVLLGGFAIECIGINTGWIFGDYQYGSTLGPQLSNTPVIIGVNWFIITYCCGIAMHSFLDFLSTRPTLQTASSSSFIKKISMVVDGATLAVLMDWLIEPVALKLGYWKWAGNGSIPMYNYISWFFASAVFLFLFQSCKFKKKNKFAIHLLLIQGMFFLLLKTFLK